MSLVEFLVLLLVAAICGAIGQALAGFSGGGCLLSSAVGLIGAVLGTWLARQLSLPPILVLSVGEVNVPIIWSIIGSALFVAVLGLLTPRRR